MKRLMLCLFAFFTLVVFAALSPPSAAASGFPPSFEEAKQEMLSAPALIAPVEIVSAAPEAVSPPGMIVSAISDFFIPPAHAIEFVAQADENPPFDPFGFVKANAGKIGFILWLISEILADSPLKSNSVFQLIRNTLTRFFAPKKEGATG